MVELAVTLGGAGMKRQLFKLLDEEQGGRSPPHIVLDGVVLVTLASLACIAPIMLVVALAARLGRSPTTPPSPCCCWRR